LTHFGAGTTWHVVPFSCTIEVTAHSWMGAQAHLFHTCDLYIASEIALPNYGDPGAAGHPGTILATRLPRYPGGVTRPLLASWMPTGGIAGQYLMPHNVAPPTGGWQGPPEVVGAIGSIGHDHGNKVYYAYVRGLPVGAEGRQYPPLAEPHEDVSTTILAYDAWRFEPSYDPVTDTVERYDDGPGRPPVRRWGSPRYAVVAIQPRAPIDWYAKYGSADKPTWLAGRIHLPGAAEDHDWRIEIGDPTIARAWWPNHVTVNDHDVTAEPDGMDRAVAYDITDPAQRPRATASGPTGDSWDIRVEVYGQDLGHNGLGVAGATYPPGPRTIVVGSIYGVRASLVVTLDGRPSRPFTNAVHRWFQTELEPPPLGGGPPPTPPPPPPGPEARRFLILFYPDVTWFEPVEGRPEEEEPPGK
jgi:hypothetical protein